MNEIMSFKELSKKIELHEILIPGDVCFRLNDTKGKTPIIINYSYASEYYVYEDQGETEAQALDKCMKQYNVLIQNKEGFWNNVAWINREELVHVGHIDSSLLYTMKLSSKLHIRTEIYTIEKLVELFGDIAPEYLTCGDLCLYKFASGADFLVYVVGSDAILNESSFCGKIPEESFNTYKIMYMDGSTEALVKRHELTFIRHKPNQFMSLYHKHNIK